LENLQRRKREETMTPMPIYTAQWVMKLAMRDQRQIVAEEMRLARVLWSASEARQPKEQSRPQKSALKRLLTSVGLAGA
jgi:hypothetical protein